MTQSRNPKSDQTNMDVLSSPAGTTSEFQDDRSLDNDVFDGIEDIYVDLEAAPPPPPPSSEDDIIEAQRLNLSSSSSSIGMNHQNVLNEDSVEYEREFPYFCGVHSSKNSPRLTNMWNIFKIQDYVEMEEADEKNTQNESPPKIRLMDNGGKQTDDEDQMKQTLTEENGGSNAVCSRETIIQHTIDEDEVREQQMKKVYPSVRDILRQNKLFGVSKENYGPNTVCARDNIIERITDEDDIRKEKAKRGNLNFLDILRQNNIFGVSKENDGPSAVCARDNTIERTTDEDDIRKEKLKKIYPYFLEILRQRKPFDKNDGSSIVGARDAIIQGNVDEDTIRTEKVKKYYPSFWDILGQRKLFGVSYRLLLLVFLNLFAFILLIILVARFTGGNTTGSNSLVDKGTLDSTESIDVSVDVPSIEDESAPINDDDEGSNISSELLSLCDEEGVTVEDGVILAVNQVLEKGNTFVRHRKPTFLL